MANGPMETPTGERDLQEETELLLSIFEDSFNRCEIEEVLRTFPNFESAWDHLQMFVCQTDDNSGDENEG